MERRRACGWSRPAIWRADTLRPAANVQTQSGDQHPLAQDIQSHLNQLRTARPIAIRQPRMARVRHCAKLALEQMPLAPPPPRNLLRNGLTLVHGQTAQGRSRNRWERGAICASTPSRPSHGAVAWSSFTQDLLPIAQRHRRHERGNKLRPAGFAAGEGAHARGEGGKVYSCRCTSQSHRCADLRGDGHEAAPGAPRAPCRRANTWPGVCGARKSRPPLPANAMPTTAQVRKSLHRSLTFAGGISGTPIAAHRPLRWNALRRFLVRDRAAAQPRAMRGTRRRATGWMASGWR